MPLRLFSSQKSVTVSNRSQELSDHTCCYPHDLRGGVEGGVSTVEGLVVSFQKLWISGKIQEFDDIVTSLFLA